MKTNGELTILECKHLLFSLSPALSANCHSGWDIRRVLHRRLKLLLPCVQYYDNQLKCTFLLLSYSVSNNVPDKKRSP